jgi:hypothetical protein
VIGHCHPEPARCNHPKPKILPFARAFAKPDLTLTLELGDGADHWNAFPPPEVGCRPLRLPRRNRSRAPCRVPGQRSDLLEIERSGQTSRQRRRQLPGDGNLSTVHRGRSAWACSCAFVAIADGITVDGVRVVTFLRLRPDHANSEPSHGPILSDCRRYVHWVSGSTEIPVDTRTMLARPMDAQSTVVSSAGLRVLTARHLTSSNYARTDAEVIDGTWVFAPVLGPRRGFVFHAEDVFADVGPELFQNVGAGGDNGLCGEVLGGFA